MKPLDHYNTLEEFTKDLEADPNFRIPFKIMGKEKKPSKKRSHGTFYSLSMLTYMHQEFSDPDQPGLDFSNIQTPVGQLLKAGVRLEGALTYSKIQPNKSGINRFQGDIFEWTNESNLVPDTQYAMVLSHSCDLTHASTVQVCPFFLERSLSPQVILSIAGKQLKDPMGSLNSWFDNENKSYLGLPPVVWGSTDERLLVDLRKQYLTHPNSLVGEPKIRLKYRALSYLQGRIAVLFWRDVYDSDESREV